MNRLFRKDQTENIRWIFRVTKPWYGTILLLTLLSIVATLLSLWNAVCFRTMVDAAVAGDRALFLSYVALTLMIAAMEILLSFLRESNSVRVYIRIRTALQERLFDTLLNKDFSHFSEKPIGDWISRVSADTDGIAMLAARVVPPTVGILVRLVGVTWLIFQVSPLFLPVMLLGFAFFIGLTILSREPMIERQRESRNAQGETRAYLTDALSQMLVLKAFSHEKQIERKGAALFETEYQKGVSRALITVYKTNAQSSGFKLGLLGIIMAGCFFLLDRRISYGTLMMCYRLLSQIRDPIISIGASLSNFYDNLVSAERLKEAESYPEDPACPVKSDAEIGDLYRDWFSEIVFRDVTFSYQDRDAGALYTAPKVFSHVDLRIPGQSIIAFTGMTGSGKSTIFKLLMSLYPLDSGTKRILFKDGTEAELDAAYRRLFAYVPQGNQLMAGSIREVVAFSEKTEEQDEERIREALRIACALDFVERLPKGLNTQIREKGLGLSEGQVQRLAIARAVYTGRPILLLDEATSSLDEKTERDLLENLKTMTDRTILIVTHRPAALSMCDMEVRVNGGRFISSELKNEAE